MNFTNGKQLLEICSEKHIPISRAMFLRETDYLEQDPVEVTRKMEHAYDIMKQAIHRALTEDLISTGGMIGGESKQMNALRKAGKNICGPLVSKAITYAVGVLEVNASMGQIVAAPTAGASGILPAIVVCCGEEQHMDDEALCMALFAAGAVGAIVAENASIAGASGGCQAETGTGAAMAAAALAQMKGADPEISLTAAAITLKNCMGLVCDPVGGLVECPCIKRNAIGVTNAVLSCDLAMAGIPSLIPFDEVVEAMKSVGDAMSSDLKETARGGVAATKTGKALTRNIL